MPPGLGPETVTGSPVGETVLLRPGQQYRLSESGPPGYSASDWECLGGESADDLISVQLGEVAICAITNDDIAPLLTLVKQVVNDDGGTAGPADWTLSADGPTPISGATGSQDVTAVPVGAGTYTLSESGPDGYGAGEWSCVGGTPGQGSA